MCRIVPISVLATHENLRNKLNTTQRLEIMKRKIRFEKFKKSVISWVNIDISVLIHNCML